MDNLFFKDPLFSVIIIIAIITLVAIADYTRNKFKLKEKKDSLKALANHFNYYEFDENLNSAIEISKAPMQTLTFIANIYVRNGNFDEAIKIYFTILDNTKDLKTKMEIFELLGIAYYKAGFMQKAKNIFIEILKNNPRNSQVLSLLMQTYETLGEYQNAYEVITCLEELEGKMDNIKTYLKVLILINDSIMPPLQREKEILKLYSSITTKLTLSYLIQNNLEKFWNLIIKSSNIYNYIDLLWNLNNPPLELIKNHKQISDVYRAKGIIKDNEECDIFELESLRILSLHSSKKGNLSFKYRCGMCQGIFPFEAHRCQSCGELGSMNLILEILEKSDEKNYSLL